MDEDWDAQQQQVVAEEQQPELFGEDEAEEEEDEDDILDMGEDDEANEKEGLLMRFCPHDSSMLYPQVCCSMSRAEIINDAGGLSLLRIRCNDSPKSFP